MFENKNLIKSQIKQENIILERIKYLEVNVISITYFKKLLKKYMHL